MKTSAIVRIILFSLAIFVLLGVLGVALGVTTYMADFSGEKSHTAQHTSNEASNTPASVESETHTPDPYIADPSQIREIEIEWAAGSITIEPTEGLTEIHVLETGVTEDKNKMICKQDGDTLSIRFCKDSIQFPSFGVNINSKDLLIAVPADWVCNSLEIDAASADVEVRDMTIRELDFDGASGMCNLTRCHVGSLDLDAASGNVSFSGCLNSLDFDGASADCTLVLTNCPSRIDLDGMSGSLDITLPSDCGFTVNTEGLSSNFSTDFATTTRNGAHHYGDGACRIEINALSGKVILRDGGYPCHTSTEDCPDEASCDTHSGRHSDHH